MRWSRSLIPTERNAPTDAEIPSHQLMVRAGLVRKLASGAYTYLPLGLRSLRKAARIVQEEIASAGAVEVLMPAIQPLELWERSGRYEQWGADLMHFTDRHGRRVALGPTHEEVVTCLARDHVRTYRQLPVRVFQVQTKFRDEVRPRFGVLRSREFLMMDAYSFDADASGLDESYRRMFGAFTRILERCGLPYVAVEADSGAIGGDASHEFMVPSDNGEDLLILCPACGYAANRERAEIGAQAPEPDAAPPAEIRQVDTPGRTTIDEVSEFLGCRPRDLVKTLVYLVDGEPTAALVRGDHEVNEAKLSRALGASRLELADPETIRRETGAPVGFAGPVGLAMRTIVDRAVVHARNAVVGANRADLHLVNVNPGRDFPVDSQADIRFADDGDPCPRCSAKVGLHRGIEIGHVFKLGTMYSEKLGAVYLDDGDQERPLVMGCYGIGVNRLLAALIESSHDEDGIVWPPALAPHRVLVLPLTAKNPDLTTAAETFYDQLTARGVDVLLDDRDARPGVKFNDADLIGFPVRVIFGERGFRNGEVEVATRRDGRVRNVALDDALSIVLELLE